jgi:hypothetical protein
MKTLLLAIILCVAIAYMYCYFVFPDDLCILQSSINAFDFNLLYRRQPLVIQDCIIDIDTLLNLWFTPNIIQDVIPDINKTWNQNCHKYCYAYAKNDTEILLYSANAKVVNDIADNDEPVLAIQLRPSQGVIIPYRWYYNIKNIEDIKFYGIHDYVTYFIDLLI